MVKICKCLFFVFFVDRIAYVIGVLGYLPWDGQHCEKF